MNTANQYLLPKNGFPVNNSNNDASRSIPGYCKVDLQRVTLLTVDRYGSKPTSHATVSPVLWKSPLPAPQSEERLRESKDGGFYVK
jgi:hypothetical protein